jgi:hypothetical protein
MHLDSLSILSIYPVCVVGGAGGGGWGVPYLEALSSTRGLDSEFTQTVTFEKKFR